MKRRKLKIKNYFITLLFFVILANFAEIKDIVICQTTDIHGNFRKEWKEDKSGWLSLCTLIKNERKNAKNKFLLIDCGDTIQGSYIASFFKGELSVKLLNDLQYDVWIIGNHDFDYGLNILKLRTSQFSGNVLAANLRLDKPTNKILSWKLFNVNGVKVAVIGMTYPALNNYIWGDKLKGFKIDDILPSLDKNIPAMMKVKPDMIILAVHHALFGLYNQKANSLYQIAKKYPQIDLILGGHIHIENEGEKIGYSTWFAQSANYADSLLKLNIKIDTNLHKVISIKSKLIPISSKVPEDKKALKIAKPFFKTIKTQGNKIIGKVSTIIEPPPKDSKILDSSMGEFIASAMFAEFQIPLVFTNAISVFAKFANNVTEENLFNALPYEDTICILELDKTQLKKVLDEQRKQKKKKRFQTLYYFMNNKVIKNYDVLKTIKNKKVKVLFNSYILAGAANRFPILNALASENNNKPLDTKILIRDAVRNKLLKKVQ